MSRPSCTDTVLGLGLINKTLDLSHTTTTEIDPNQDPAAVQVVVRVTKDFYLAVASNLASGNAKIVDNNQRVRHSAGYHIFGVVGWKDEKIYIRAATESEAEGLSYSIYKGTKL